MPSRKKHRSVYDRDQRRFVWVPVGSDLDREVAEHVEETRREPLPGQKELPMDEERKKK